MKMSEKFKYKLFVLFGVPIALVALIFGYLMLMKISSVKQRIDHYAINQMQTTFGSALLEPQFEAKILKIAQEMGINEPIVIRKMNMQALQRFGYANAFACWAQLLGFIPFSNQPFMYLSDGFLEDLSEAEQRFLIGHELIHVRERHVLFFNLSWVLGILFLLAFFYLAQNYLHERFKIKSFVLIVFKIIGIYLSLAIPNLAGLAYRRSIEKFADCESFRLLNSYEGCLKMLERWQKDFKIAPHNPYFGLLSDHPSCFERESYCLKHQFECHAIK